MTPAEHNETQQPNLKAFLDNELPLWRRLAVRLHLARCASCREEMQAMQRISNELREQSQIDPLDPNLRARILATVREITPEPVAPAPSRRPVLVWGGTAFAALLLVAFFASHALFAPRALLAPVYKDASAASPPASASSPVVSAPGPLPAAPEVADKSAAEAPVSRSSAPTASAGAKTDAASSSVGRTAARHEAKRQAVATSETQAPSAGASLAKPQGAFAEPVPQDKSVAENSASDASKRAKMPSAFGGARQAAGGGFDGNQQSANAKKSPDTIVGSSRYTEAAGEAKTAARTRPSQNPIVLERAGFDLNGYRFVTQSGQRIDVPFRQSLDAVRFARATDGRMELAESAATPILYLSPADTLLNDAVPGARWQPLPPGYTATQPLFIHPTPDWEQFLTMRWYSNMTVVGGTASARTGDAFAVLPGSHVQIGATRYSDFAAYRAFADAHPDSLRLRAVHDNAASIAPAAPPAAAAKGAGRAGGKPHP